MYWCHLLQYNSQMGSSYWQPQVTRGKDTRRCKASPYKVRCTLNEMSCADVVANVIRSARSRPACLLVFARCQCQTF